MSSYNYNNIAVYSPVGSIMQYLGTDDPDGWIVCNGVARTNDNEIYNNLYSLGIGTLVNGMYTPPNLTERFLLGGSTVTDINSNTGNSSVKLSIDNLANHTHDMNHSHYMAASNVPGATAHGYGYFLVGLADGLIFDNIGTTTSYDGRYNRGNDLRDNTDPAGASTIDQTSIDLSPPSYTINYILKY